MATTYRKLDNLISKDFHVDQNKLERIKRKFDRKPNRCSKKELAILLNNPDTAERMQCAHVAWKNKKVSRKLLKMANNPEYGPTVYRNLASKGTNDREPDRQLSRDNTTKTDNNKNSDLYTHLFHNTSTRLMIHNALAELVQPSSEAKDAKETTINITKKCLTDDSDFVFCLLQRSDYIHLRQDFLIKLLKNIKNQNIEINQDGLKKFKKWSKSNSRKSTWWRSLFYKFLGKSLFRLMGFYIPPKEKLLTEIEELLKGKSKEVVPADDEFGEIREVLDGAAQAQKKVNKEIREVIEAQEEAEEGPSVQRPVKIEEAEKSKSISPERTATTVHKGLYSREPQPISHKLAPNIIDALKKLHFKPVATSSALGSKFNIKSLLTLVYEKFFQIHASDSSSTSPAPTTPTGSPKLARLKGNGNTEAVETPVALRLIEQGNSSSPLPETEPTDGDDAQHEGTPNLSPYANNIGTPNFNLNNLSAESTPALDGGTPVAPEVESPAYDAGSPMLVHTETLTEGSDEDIANATAQDASTPNLPTSAGSNSNNDTRKGFRQISRNNAEAAREQLSYGSDSPRQFKLPPASDERSDDTLTKAYIHAKSTS